MKPTTTTVALTSLATTIALLLTGCCCGDAAKMVTGSTELIQGMRSAPGAQDVRDAGCQEAMVLTPETLKKFTELFAPEESDTSDVDKVTHHMVMCQVPTPDTKMTCKDVAKAYTGAKDVDQKEVVVSVNAQGQEEPVCSGLFNTKGKRLGDADTSSFGNLTE